MKKLVTILTTFLLCFAMVLSVSATESNHPSRVVDEADLLTSEEESRLLNELNEISERQQFDVVVVTVDSLGGKSAEAFADDYFDYNGYGMGESYDGALMLVSIEYRDWQISTCGYGITALNDRNLAYMEDEIVYYLSDGEYYEAFSEFGSLCDQFVTDAQNGTSSTSGSPSAGTNPLTLLLGCLLLGFLFAMIPVYNMKKQMKSVYIRQEASDYIRRDKTMITKSRDAFLYHTVTRKRRPKETSNGGGGSTVHRSSSGRSHGGRGGKF